MRSNISIEAAGIIPVSPMDVAGVPDIALSIPDFEGQALLRIFSNRTQAQIGCFAAQIINGNTFRHNAEVGTILGSFTAIAMVASFATAIYGEDIVEIRKHYTNSCSVVTIFAVWHHIYFSGALSMNWPSVLVAFWSNYAWTAGMIYSEQMQNSINDFMGANMRNLSQVGAAGQEPRYPNLAGEYNVSRIYREPSNSNGTKIILPHFKRDFGISATSGFRFEGQPVKPGLSLPGNYSGFAGTLSQDNIPISNAFLTSFFWFLILIAGLLVLLVLYRGFLEVGVRINLIAQNHLRLFRHRFGRYTALTTLRTIIASFFMVIFLSMVQLTYVRSPGPVAIAIFAFLMLVVGLGGAVCFTCYSLITSGYITICHDHLNIVKARRWRILPWYRISRQSTTPNVEDMIYLASLPIWTISLSSRGKSIHSDQHQVTSFGWLTARYRRTRWWFFAIWLIYDFIRASFLAGTCDRPFLQVLGLLTIEIVAFALFCYLRPFEGQQLNVLCVYFLGISKIATAALSATFDARFSLSRMLTTVIALVIIVIQGTLTIVVFIMIAVSVVTSYMSIMRNRAEIWPVSWNRMRENYLRHLELRSEDIPGFSPNRSEDSTAQGEKLHAGSYFAVNHVRRVPKIDDDEFLQE